MAPYLHCQVISVIPYLADWLIHHPDRQVLLRYQSQLLHKLNMVGLKLNEVKSELEPVQDIQFLGLQLCLDQGEAPNIQGSGDNSKCVSNILPVSAVVQSSIPVHGITQLGLRSHPTGTTVHEADTTTLLLAHLWGAYAIPVALSVVCHLCPP